MKKFYKSPSGITIIALTITIIVLLILASVSIWTLIGDKNIINQSFEAKNQTNSKDIVEEITQQWLLVQNDTRNEYYDNSTLASMLQERLKNKDSNATVEYQNDNFIISFRNTNNLKFNLKTGQFID